MPKVTKEHILDAYNKNINDTQLAKKLGVTRQAVYQMRKKYFPGGIKKLKEKSQCQ